MAFRAWRSRGCAIRRRGGQQRRAGDGAAGAREIGAGGCLWRTLPAGHDWGQGDNALLRWEGAGGGVVRRRAQLGGAGIFAGWAAGNSWAGVAAEVCNRCGACVRGERGAPGAGDFGRGGHSWWWRLGQGGA